MSEKEFTRIIEARQLNLCACLFSGQSFGWDILEQNTFQGFFVYQGQTHTARLRRHGNEVWVRTTGPEEWFDRYFNLDVDLDAVVGSFPDDPDLALAVRRYQGLRVLAQDPWEATVSFIISQNNNIPRIRLILRRMINVFGRFPMAQDLVKHQEMAKLGLGYRARYLHELGRAVLSGEFDPQSLFDMDDHEAMAALGSLTGIGPKVASCILLYGYNRHRFFPVDVWIRRRAKPIDYGPYAGWAQLYLYALARGLDASC